MHLLTYRIKDTWCKRNVASVIFLNIKEVFSNTMPEKLACNMKQREVPSKIVKFTVNMLTNRVMKLKFDDYISDTIPIDNRIGQGDPLSMGLSIL